MRFAPHLPDLSDPHGSQPPVKGINPRDPPPEPTPG